MRSSWTSSPKAARDTKTSDQAQRLDKYREELGKLVGKGTIGWDDAMLLGQLAEEIRP